MGLGWVPAARSLPAERRLARMRQQRHYCRRCSGLLAPTEFAKRPGARIGHRIVEVVHRVQQVPGGHRQTIRSARVHAALRGASSALYTARCRHCWTTPGRTRAEPLSRPVRFECATVRVTRCGAASIRLRSRSGVQHSCALALLRSSRCCGTHERIAYVWVRQQRLRHCRVTSATS